MHGGTGVTGLVLGAAAAIVRDGTESDKVVIIAAKKSHNKHSQSSLMTLSSRLRRKTSLVAAITARVSRLGPDSGSCGRRNGVRLTDTRPRLGPRGGPRRCWQPCDA